MCSTIREFSRDSFDRFGDDLCEEILRYLPLSDCFGLQCVSKQFNALIFNKQTKLTLTDGKWYVRGIDEYENSIIKEFCTNYGLKEFDSTLKYDILNYALKKCVNINHFIIKCDYFIRNKTINILIKTCKHIKHLSIFVLERHSKKVMKCWQRFAKNSLQNLESLTFYEECDNKIITSLLLLCPKLRKIHSDWNAEKFIDRCIDANPVFGTKLESVHGYRVEDQRFKVFADRFKHQLKSLSVWIDYNFDETRVDLIKHLTEFENLEYLYGLFLYNGDKCIEVLKLIGLKCLRLKVLEIEGLSSPLCDAFNNNGFQSLKKLNLIDCDSDFKSFEFLKKCVHLTHLIIYGYTSDGSDFNDIHLYLPQLKSIDVYLPEESVRETLITIMEHLEKLANLYDLKIGREYATDDDDNYCGIITDDVISFIDHCLTIRMITLYPKEANIDQTLFYEFIDSNSRRIEIKTADNELKCCQINDNLY